MTTRTEILITVTAVLFAAYLGVAKLEKSSRTFYIWNTPVDMVMPDGSWGNYQRILARSPKNDGLYIVLSNDGRKAEFFPWDKIYLIPDRQVTGIYVVPANRTRNYTRQLFAVFPKYSATGDYILKYRPKNLPNPIVPFVMIKLETCYDYWVSATNILLPSVFFLLFSLLLTLGSFGCDIRDHWHKKKFSLA
jgi:hypothetical protein